MGTPILVQKPQLAATAPSQVCEQEAYGDHAGGIAPVLRVFPTSEFADSGQRYAGFAYNDALQVAKADSTPIVYPRAGMVWRTTDGVTLTFIGPSLLLLTHTRNDINNNSLAFILQYGNFRMLFTGDAGAEAESGFLAEGIDLHADVQVCASYKKRPLSRASVFEAAGEVFEAVPSSHPGVFTATTRGFQSKAQTRRDRTLAAPRSF